MRRRSVVAVLAAGATATAACTVGARAGGGRGGSDGAQLAFATDGNIQVMAADGAGRHALTKVPVGALAKDPAWSPDGKRIAYAYTPPLPAVRGPGGLVPLPVTGIYVMNADGSEQTVVIPHQTPGVGHETPLWASDGRSFLVTYTELLMESNIVKDQVLEVARVTPGNPQRQTLVPNGAFPTLSADGTRLACIVSTRDGQALVVASADGKNVRPLVPAGQMNGLAAPRFSPDGKQLVFSAVAPIAPIPTVTPFPGRSTAPLTWLDGVLGVPTAQAHGLPMDLYLISVDGGPAARVTELGEDNPAATWSPDGKQLAILAGGGIYTLLATGQGLRSLDSKGGHGSIDWRRT